MIDLLQNRLLWAAAGASVAAQLIKVLLAFIAESPTKAVSRLFETGGMPSAHSASVSALAIGVGLQQGWGSPLFAVTAVFGYIVIYDATGVRRAAGLHAAVLNHMLDRLGDHLGDDITGRALKTLLGHTYPEVVAGVVIGVIIGWVTCHK